MKNLLIVLMIVVLGVAVASGVRAFPGVGNVTGTRTESVVKDVGKMVVVSETNKKLSGKATACKCNVSTGTVSGCDYAGIKNMVDNAKTGIETGLNGHADFNVKAASQSCASQVQSNITGWWYWQTRVDPSLGSSLKMWLD